MRMRHAVILASLALACLAAAQQTFPAARQYLQDAQDKSEKIYDKDSRAYHLAQIAEAWQPIDKNVALTTLKEAADTAPKGGDAWRDILSIWANQNQDAAFQQSLTLANPQRTGEVLAIIAQQNPDKAAADVAKIPQSFRQSAAQAAVHELAANDQEACEPFIQALTNVQVGVLYKIVAEECEDPKLALNAAQKAGDERDVAMAEAIRKTAETDPVVAHDLVAQITSVNERAIALSYIAQSFNRSDANRAKQAAAEAINLYNQSEPDWPKKSSLFTRIEPQISDIDSPEVRDMLQHFTDAMMNHFSSDNGDESTAPEWLLRCAAAWSYLDLPKARQLVGRALQIDPNAGANNQGLTDYYERFLDQLVVNDQEDTVSLLTALKGDSIDVYRKACKQLLTDLAAGYKQQARTVGKELKGDFPNVAETEIDIAAMNPDTAADGLLRLESDSFTPEEFSEDSMRFVDVLLAADPYKAVRAIINLEAAAHRIPLLSHIIVAIAKSNNELATSTYEKAVQDLSHVQGEDAVTANTALAHAATALGK